MAACHGRVQGWCGTGDRFCGDGRCYGGACKSVSPPPPPRPKCVPELLMHVLPTYAGHLPCNVPPRLLAVNVNWGLRSCNGNRLQATCISQCVDAMDCRSPPPPPPRPSRRHHPFVGALAAAQGATQMGSRLGASQESCAIFLEHAGRRRLAPSLIPSLCLRLPSLRRRLRAHRRWFLRRRDLHPPILLKTVSPQGNCCAVLLFFLISSLHPAITQRWHASLLTTFPG